MKKGEQRVSVDGTQQRIRKSAHKNPKTEFIVADLPRSFSGKGYAMLTKNDLEKYGFLENDIVEILGNRKTYAKLIEKPKPKSIPGIEIPPPIVDFPRIQLDFSVRKNAEIKTGDHIKIRKVSSKIVPVKKLILIAENTSYINKIKDYKEFKEKLNGRVIRKGDEIWLATSDSKLDRIHTPPSNPIELYFTVFFTEPKTKKLPMLIDRNTVIKIRKTPLYTDEQIIEDDVYLEDVGGLYKAKENLMELAGIVVNEHDFISKAGLKFTNSILLSGPSGCGKTLLSKAIINEFPVSYFYINASEIAGAKPTEAPEEISKIFEEAKDASPSIILIDEVESIATNREDLRFDSVMRNLVTQFLHILETVSNRNDLLVIGTTNRPESIDTGFLTQTRFGKEIKITPPKKDERIEILTIMMDKMDVIDNQNLDIDEIAENTYGFSGADLNILFQTTFIHKLKSLNIYDRFVKSKLSYNLLREKIQLKTADFINVLHQKLVKPTILRSYTIETPKISFNQVGGLKEPKQLLKENIQYPSIYPELYKHYNVNRFKGLLLHGPPGCGKTLLIKALASESNMNFISIKGAEILNHWLGESEAAIRQIFAKAKDSAPCIIFFDELDAVATVRGIDGNVHSDRVTAQILTELDGIEGISNIICIGATNRLDIIDPALMRPGRLYPVIEVGLPDADARKEILQIYLKTRPIADDVKVDNLVSITEGFNGAELEELCNQASVMALRDIIETDPEIDAKSIPPISEKHFLKAAKKIKTKIKKTRETNLYS